MPATAAKLAPLETLPQVSQAKPRATKAGKNSKSAPKLSNEAVLAWLTANPAFFHQHSAALGQLSLPKKGGNILSLHAAKAEKVQKQASKLELRHTRLLQRAEQTTLIANQIFATVLSLLSCNSLAEIRTYLQTGLQTDLGIDAARLLLIGPATTASTISQEDLDSLAPRTAQLRNLANPADRALYGPKGKNIHSDCLLRLETNARTLGLLAVGSKNAAHFHAGQSTHLATFLSQAVSLCIAKFLPQNA